MKRLRYAVEAFFLIAALSFFRALPLDTASALGGMLARLLGPLSRGHRIADTNIERALPEIPPRERAHILSQMWDNLGRTVGEYPHLSQPVMRRRITVEGQEHLDHVRNSNTGAIFVSGHFANWEIIPLTAALLDFPLTLIYRAPNNPVTDRVLRHVRMKYSRNLFGKGREAARAALKAMKEHKPMGILVDQKMNDGIPVKLFGRLAMTAPAAAELALRFGVPILPTRVVRTDGAYFHVTIYPPMRFGKDATAQGIMEDIHRHFERWIRERPAQWFWVHRRWNWNN